MNRLDTFDVKTFLDDRGIKWYESGKNVSAGWIGIKCLFCADHSHHMGINLVTKKFSCWRCGESGGPAKMISAVDKQRNRSYVDNILKQYISGEMPDMPELVINEKLELPEFFSPITRQWNPGFVTNFFKERRYDPEFYLRKMPIWTSIVGYLKYRVLFPVFLNGEMVNFSARTIYPNIEPKYRACPNVRAVKPLNQTLYGIDEVKEGDHIVVVEGMFDQWRLSSLAPVVASWGIVLTVEQAALLRSKKPRRISFLFDSDVTDRQADAAVKQIWFCPVSVFFMEKGDPDNLSPMEAQKVVAEITA